MLFGRSLVAFMPKRRLRCEAPPEVGRCVERPPQLLAKMGQVLGAARSCVSRTWAVDMRDAR